ncbi:hypothetical protein CJF30_00005239 [Rutstroemia sp. NJR-2017a BBW]|nr:hypothetical protein CJF30_00005239 [Rutstroemia sp. NJR-2017a BBW]
MFQPTTGVPSRNRLTRLCIVLLTSKEARLESKPEYKELRIQQYRAWCYLALEAARPTRPAEDPINYPSISAVSNQVRHLARLLLKRKRLDKPERRMVGHSPKYPRACYYYRTD